MPENFDPLNTTKNVRIQLRCEPGLNEHLQAEAERMPLELRADWRWKVDATLGFLRAKERDEAAIATRKAFEDYGTSVVRPSVTGNALVPARDDDDLVLSSAPKPKRLFLLDMLLPADIAPDVHLNLGDLYPIWLYAHGKDRADIIYNVQVARIIFGCSWNWALRTVERILRSVRLVGPS